MALLAEIQASTR